MINVKEVEFKNFKIGNKGENLTLIAGPCAIESYEVCDKVAGAVSSICKKYNINYIFKGSYDKANRSSIKSKRGSGFEKGLEILQAIKDKYNVPIITDVHEPFQCNKVKEVADVIQIPAFLCRQTDLLMAAAKTGKAINVKKGQFLAPWDMINIVKKLEYYGNNKILLCERGTSFGYNNLIVDMRSFIDMREFNYPIIYDVTHSLQKPGGRGVSTGGDRKYAHYMMRAALAIGVDGIFLEVHPNPDNAISDSSTQIPLENIEKFIKDMNNFRNI